MKGELNLFSAEGKTFSSDYLIKVGLSLPNNNALTSAVIEIIEVNDIGS